MDTKKLRQKVLDLAIHGKLVKQDPNDEPASILLDRIRAEKARLVKEGKIKKTDLIEKPISEDEIPFEVPEGWEWVRLSVVSDVRDGTHDTPNYVPKGYPLITSKDFFDGGFDLRNTKYISESDYRKIIQRSKVEIGDILYSMIGGNIGNNVIITKNNYFEMAIKNVALFKQYSTSVLSQKFLLIFLNAQIKKIQSIAIGGAQSFVSLKVFRNYPFPLPPLAEQHRIVKAVDELFEQIDIIERSERELEEAANKTRDKLLNLAIQGHLVPQDPNEEPASVLLERIRAEKARLVQQGKLNKKDLEEKPISPDEIPFDLPEGWVWCRLSDIAYILNGYAFKSSMYVDKGIRVIRITNVQNGAIVDDDPKYYPITEKSVIQRYLLTKGDLLMSLTGNIGRVGIIGDNLLPAALNQRVACIRFYDERTKIYIFNYFLSEFFRKRCIASGKGMAQQNMSTDWLSNDLLPLPPLAEQRRIVSKLEELLHEIDKLKG